MKWASYVYILLIICLTGVACTPNNGGDNPSEVSGFVPVYGQGDQEKIITAGVPRPTVNAGKIYTVGTLLLQVEQDSGIHVIDYANAQQPVKIGFIRSFLCKELAMKNGFIYTNNLSDLVVIDINDINNVREVSRVPGVFPDLALQYPPKSNPNSMIYFECPDPSKGMVIGWKQQTIKNPKCRR